MKESWYKMYPLRWHLSRQVMKMTMVQKGLYITALNLSFIEGGFIDKQLLMASRQECSEKDVDLIIDQFVEKSGNQYFHPIILEQIEYINMLSDAGKEGAKRRWKDGEPNGEPNGDPNGTANADKIREDKKKILATFEIFWNHYHKISTRPKEEKAPAEKKWARLSLIDQRAAYLGVKKYCANVREVQYIKLARTYLEDRSWENDYTITKKSRLG